MRVGLVNGCFDGLHPGHVFFLERARKECDWLIIAVNSDASVKRLKGKDRPYRDLETRMRGLACSAYPQAVIPFDGDALVLALAIVPDVIIRGEDQREECPSDIELVRVPRLQGFSTTELR